MAFGMEHYMHHKYHAHAEAAALEDAQHAFQKVLADLGQMEAPQITISSDERPPTPEPVLIQQPAMDPELLEALEKLEFVMPTAT